MDLKNELEVFLKELKEYREILTNPQSRLLSSLVKQNKKPSSFLVEYLEKKSDEEIKKEIIEERREKLLSSRGAYKNDIFKLLGLKDNIRFNRTWDKALSLMYSKKDNEAALSLCIDYTIEAIGNLTINEARELDRQEKEKISELFGEPLDVIRIKNNLMSIYSDMDFHPKVIQVSKSCFRSKNYRAAIIDTYISLISYIKEIANLDLDGDDLMNQAFSFDYDTKLKTVTKYPKIYISNLKTKYDRDKQTGFWYLCRGAVAFFRNRFVHKLIFQKNPKRTLEYLSFASLLFRQLDNRIQSPPKEHKS